MDEYHKVMTENFAERFVDHRNIGLAAKAISELTLHHGERGLDVAALVIVLQKLIAPELEVMIHPLPRPTAIPPMMGSERDERRSSKCGDSLCIALTGIALVRRDFGDLKVPSSGVGQSRENNRIVCVPSKNFYSGNDVRFRADHQVTLNPIVLLPNLSVLMVKPAGETASSEARRISGKISFNGLQRQAGFSDELLQDARQVRILKVVGNTVKVRDFGDVTASVRFSQVGHETALRNRAVDLERDIEQRIRQGQTRATLLRWSGDKARAQVVEQGLEFILLVCLRL